jgi:hypothetical protein
MRGHVSASANFGKKLLSEDAEHQAAIRGFHLRNGGWKGPGWQQISWKRRKRQEEQQVAAAAEKKRLIGNEQRRITPLGRMEDDSLEAWNKIESAKYRTALTREYTEMMSYAEEAQSIQNMGSMSYQELLSGLLYPGEELQYIPPARVKHFQKLRHDGTVLEDRKKVRVFFTDKRLFFIHTDFLQQPTVKFDDPAGALTLANVKLGCVLEDNMYWTAMSLEKILGQTIDCEYRAMASTVVVVSRPWWGAWMVKIGLLSLVALAFVRSLLHMAAVSGITLLLLGSGAHVLLNLRHYAIKPNPTDKFSCRSIIFGVDDPVAMERVTLNLELEDDYRLDNAFEFIQGLRTVSRQLRGEVLTDTENLLDVNSLVCPHYSHTVTPQFLPRIPPPKKIPYRCAGSLSTKRAWTRMTSGSRTPEKTSPSLPGQVVG